VIFGDDSGHGAETGSGHGSGTLSKAHIVPAEDTVTVAAGSTKTVAYKVMGVLNGSGPEQDITDRFVFYVPKGYFIATFPANGSPTLTTVLPAAPTDPPQQGGQATIQAQAQNPGGALLTVTTGLTVKLTAQLADPSGATLPSNPQNLFGGPVDTTRAPVLAYPNDGTMFPPNLQQLEVHWTPGPASNTTLYKIEFSSSVADIVYFVRCGVVSNGGLVPGACALQLDATGYGYLAASNAGAGNVALTVSGTDDMGTSYGSSTTFQMQFAEEAVNGGVYYWDVSDTQIMDFQFGSVGVLPQIWMAPGDYGTGGTCVGCHTISADGTKIAASMGGQNDGRILYLDDTASVPTPPPPARTDPTYLTLGTNDTTDTSNHMQFASFDPRGDQFVAVYGDNGGTAAQDSLYFHDGTTGLIIPTATVTLDFEPDHPNWSPDGTMIALTHVGVHNTSQREYFGGIDVATWSSLLDGSAGLDSSVEAEGPVAGSLGTPIVILPSMRPGMNQFNPSFVPDSSFLLYSVATCPAGQETQDTCDSDVANNLDEVVTVDGGSVIYTTTTWAVKPVAGATPVHLDNAAKEGVADTLPTIDTFPRSTPFKTTQGSGELFWFTVASQRAPGLRLKVAHPNNNPPETAADQQLLWMCALDPAKILAGTDGSYPCFLLPFQNFSTSNHIAEWTQKIVGSTAPPPAPAPPPPPPAPAPPPPPR
jgi:hypothetical protein